MTKFLLVRRLYGLPQRKVAETLGITQRTYATYDSGKTKKVPYEIVKFFSNNYKVHEAWLLGQEIKETIICDIKRVTTLTPDSISNAAEDLNIPRKFLEAIYNGEVVCSEDLYVKIMDKYSKIKVTTSDPAHTDKFDTKPPLSKREQGLLELYQARFDMTVEQYKIIEEKNKVIEEKNKIIEEKNEQIATLKERILILENR